MLFNVVKLDISIRVCGDCFPSAAPTNCTSCSFHLVFILQLQRRLLFVEKQSNTKKRQRDFFVFTVPSVTFFSSIVSNFFLIANAVESNKIKIHLKFHLPFFKVFTLQYRTPCSYAFVGELMQDVFNLQQNLFMFRSTFCIFLRTLHTTMVTINSVIRRSSYALLHFHFLNVIIVVSNSIPVKGS